jgi:omega-6 fatty acid desaturase (delta-12 desaturase)
VHHLSAKIPNYRLRAAHDSHPMFRRTPVVTLRSSIETFRLKLWDTESEALVPFPGRRLTASPQTAATKTAAGSTAGRQTLPAS